MAIDITERTVVRTSTEDVETLFHWVQDAFSYVLLGTHTCVPFVIVIEVDMWSASKHNRAGRRETRRFTHFTDTTLDEVVKMVESGIRDTRGVMAEKRRKVARTRCELAIERVD